MDYSRAGPHLLVRHFCSNREFFYIFNLWRHIRFFLQHLGQKAGAPERGAQRLAFQRGHDHPLDALDQNSARHARARYIAHALNVLLDKASLPFVHCKVTNAQARGDG